MRFIPPFLIMAAIAACATTAPAREIVPGPVDATVLRIIDGDSFIAQAHVWPGHSVTVSVRIRGIDAPEMKSHCLAERQAAEAARSALASLIGGAPVSITNIGGGKYYGRVLADVVTGDGHRVGEALLAASLVRPYAGGKRIAYCG